MIALVRAFLLHELRLSLRGSGGVGMTLSFFLLAALIIPFSVGNEPGLLVRIGPGVLWVALVLATLISLEHLFQADYEDGSLDLLILSPLPLTFIAVLKALVHWLTCALPLILAIPLVGLLYGLDGASLRALMLAMTVGTPALSFLGAVVAALCLSVRRGGLLVALLLLPLFVPILIFGVMAADVSQGQAAHAAFLFLCAFNLATLALAPYVVARAIKLHLD